MRTTSTCVDSGACDVALTPCLFTVAGAQASASPARTSTPTLRIMVLLVSCCASPARPPLTGAHGARPRRATPNRHRADVGVQFRTSERDADAAAAPSRTDSGGSGTGRRVGTGLGLHRVRHDLVDPPGPMRLVRGVQ